jgi:hypothetical protein
MEKVKIAVAGFVNIILLHVNVLPLGTHSGKI